MIIEFHILKNYPSTNLNRDETGSPKTAFFSGHLRGRISSQCVKRSWRKSIWFDALDLGIRTRNLPSLVCNELTSRGVDPSFIPLVQKKLTGLGNKETKETTDGKTAQIVFYSSADIKTIADVIQKTISECTSLKEFEKFSIKEWQVQLKDASRPVTIDIALFGRMVTDDSFANVEAAMQVAHAISTNAVNQESDFFTAVDDLNGIYGTDAGSAMMGDIDYNANCYYQYASLDIDQLRDNMKGNPDTQDIIKKLMPALIQAMAFSNPTGKQNSFAGHVVPSLICIEKKDKKIPISYINAFEKPVRKNYSEESALRLIEEIENFEKCYGRLCSDRLWFAPKSDKMPQNSTAVSVLAELFDTCSEWM